MKRQLSNVGDMGRKIAEYENRIAILSQELERQNILIDSKNKEIKSLNETSMDADGLARQVRNLSDQIKRLTG